MNRRIASSSPVIDDFTPPMRAAMAITVAFVASALTSLGLGGFDLDFWWELALLIVIMLLGHWLEMRALGQASSALDALAALRSDPSAVACVANGFRDTTRVAGGDPGLWTGIALENRTALLARLQTASDTLTELLEILRKPDEEELRRFLAEAQSLRQTVPAAAP